MPRRLLLLLLLLVAGPGCDPVAVTAPPDRDVASCEIVRLDAAVSGAVRASRWEVVRGPVVSIDALGSDAAVLRAPAVATPTELELRLVVEDASGASTADTTTLTILPAVTPPGLPPGTFPDCAPFEHGVASGDPDAHSVLLWTRLTPPAGASRAVAMFELALDPGFDTVVRRGAAETDASRDFTIQVVADGLAPATTYWFRFRALGGLPSPVGRTRTAPAGATDHARFAVASCSSLYSGWFNAYRRIAERDDLDLVIHLGDYLYDFVDAEERVRVPTPPPPDPNDLAGWRARHADYLMDPDLRAARARHPWFVMWDNHDLSQRQPPAFGGGVQAFREWVPMRQPDPLRPEIAYRTLRFGDLVDVRLLDVLLHRGQGGTVPGTSEPSMLGHDQFAWLAQELAGPAATWRILGTQKVFGTVRVDPFLALQIDGEARPVFDTNAWDGFPASRSQLLALLEGEGLGDNVVISGDSHVTIAMDLVDDPANPAAPYDPATGIGAQGVELLPTSISRGNFDEQLRGLGVVSPLLEQLLGVLQADTAGRNPHHLLTELTQHGYGVLDFTRDRLVAEVWYSPILARADAETLGARITALRGANRWSRP